ncbi:hypothetical protein GCM10010282_72990 [Streptomyces roseolus]|nr:hypothetical protein GCM10010282_72990 [Streptomyces roseolus]
MFDRMVLADQVFTGVSRLHLARLLEELADPWQAAVEGRRHQTRGGVRKRAAGAGARHQLVFIDRLAATLIHLRHDLPHPLIALLLGVGRSTVSRAIGEILGLLAERGCAVPTALACGFGPWRTCSLMPRPRAEHPRRLVRTDTS